MRQLASGCLAALLTSTLLLAPAVRAAGEEERARKLVNDAMENDYLATEFKAALAKLQNALGLCQQNKCSKETLARIHRALGTVQSAGMNNHEAAVESFKEMLRLEPSLTPDPSFLTGQVQKAFDEARAASGPAPVVVDRSVKPLKETPWSEQATYNPLPVYVELPEGVEATRVVVRYRGPGMTDWMELQLRPHEGGYGGLIPCAAVEREGEILYFVTAFDTNLDRVASAGSAQEPRRVKLKKAIGGRQPSLPGSVPPTACPRPEEVLSCETDDDCPGNQVCMGLTCQEAPDRPEEDPDAKPRFNHVTLTISPDLTLMTGTKDACSPSAQEGKTACFYSDDSQFDVPNPRNPGDVQAGIAPGSVRVLLGYDRVLLSRITLGARLGVAFLGTPKRERGEDFSLFHGELRLGAHLFKDAYARKGVRPYAYLSAGYGTASGKLTTKVAWDEGPERFIRAVTVYQQGGPTFAGGGLGVEYAVSLKAAMRIELGARQYLGDSSTVFTPSLGFALGL